MHLPHLQHKGDDINYNNRAELWELIPFVLLYCVQISFQSPVVVVTNSSKGQVVQDIQLKQKLWWLLLKQGNL